MQFYLHLTQANLGEPRRIQVVTYTPESVSLLPSDYSAILILSGDSDQEYLFSLLGLEYAGEEMGIVEITESALRQKMITTKA
jgi:hypothetical protein